MLLLFFLSNNISAPLFLPVMRRHKRLLVKKTHQVPLESWCVLERVIWLEQCDARGEGLGAPRCHENQAGFFLAFSFWAPKLDMAARTGELSSTDRALLSCTSDPRMNSFLTRLLVSYFLHWVEVVWNQWFKAIKKKWLDPRKPSFRVDTSLKAWDLNGEG